MVCYPPDKKREDRSSSLFDFHEQRPAMITIDALCFPHIIDSVLFHLHFDAQYATLASFRLTCSALKHVIDSRLPLHKAVAYEATNNALSPGSHEHQQHFHLYCETRLWNAYTDRRSTNRILEVVDVTIMAAASRCGPNFQLGPVPVVRIFDYPGGPIPSATNTVIIFPSSSHFAVPAASTRYVELSSTASRIVINMPYESKGGPHDRPPDFNFGYAAAKAHDDDRGLKNIVQQPQQLVLMFSNSSCGDLAEPGRYLKDWMFSLAKVLCHNPSLEVILLADNWNWVWFCEDDDPEWGDYHGLMEYEDGPQRLNVAWRALFFRYLIHTPAIYDPESSASRIWVLTMAEYAAEIGHSLFELMLID